MLGNMNKEATSQKSLTLPFWRLLVASGILAIVIGFFNVIAVSLLFSVSITIELMFFVRALCSATAREVSQPVVSARVAPLRCLKPMPSLSIMTMTPSTRPSASTRTTLVAHPRAPTWVSRHLCATVHHLCVWDRLRLWPWVLPPLALTVARLNLVLMSLPTACQPSRSAPSPPSRA
jgi:hypothetical protein